MGSFVLRNIDHEFAVKAVDQRDINRRFNWVLSDEMQVQTELLGHTLEVDLFTTSSKDLRGTLAYRGVEFPGLYLFQDGFIIENTDTGKVVAVDFQDGIGLTWRMLTHPDVARVYTMHYSISVMRECRIQEPWKTRPFLYFDMCPKLTRSMREEIRDIRQAEPRDERLFFAGTIGVENGYGVGHAPGGEWRATARVLQQKYPDETLILDRNHKLPRKEFWKEAARHSWSLFLPGHPWCNREHELWSLGLPTMGPEISTPVYVPLVPYEHYLPFPTPAGQDRYMRPLDPEQAADNAIALHRQVIKNDTLANGIASRAQERMDNRASVWAVAKAFSNELFGDGGCLL